MQAFYDSPAMFSSHQSPMRGMHDIPMTSVFPDTDSGFSSLKTPRKNLFADNDIMMSSPRSSILSNPMRRSRSLSKLNGSFTSQDFSPPPVVSPFHKPLDRSIRHLKDNLEDSENRRAVLMHKLKEAQDTLELQSNRLGKIENTAKGNTFLVEDLKLKEREYREKIKDLEKGRDEKDLLKIENIRLREEMQDRIDKLDFQLRSLQAQHQVVENENQKRISLLDQSSTALSMLEDENSQIKKERDIMKTEVAVAKEAMQIARNRFEPLEDENRSLRTQVQQLKQENAELSKKLSELTGQLMELRKLTQSMKDENEKLASSWKSVTEEKQSVSRQLEGAQNKLADLKTKASSASTEKDKLFQEKLDLNNKFQQLLINKEQLERAKCELEEQLYHQEGEAERIKKSMKKKEEEKNKKEEKIYEMDKKNQELAAELSSVKAFYDRAVEQIGSLESAKKASTQQQDWIQQENSRLKNEVDRLSKMKAYTMADSRHRELKKENEQLEGNLQNYKDEVRQLRNDRTTLENKIHELETKLRKANEDIKKSTSRGQQELDTWKDTCDRLTASVSRKEAEIQDLQDKCLDNEDLIAKQQEELRTLKDECDRLSEQHEDIKKLKDENRKMHQEKAENEQMIKLLETQKEVLAQSTEHQLAKLHDAEHLTGKVEQLRNDKEQLRERVLELEKVRDNLIRQKEELLASSELIYKKPKLEELESKIEELREANRQLRDINENINERYEALEERPNFSPLLTKALAGLENYHMKQAMGGEGQLVPKVEHERLANEKEQLGDNLEHLRREYDSLQERHRQYMEDYGPDGEEAQREKDKIKILEKEKDGLEKQVALINGQLLLVESSKKRLDEVVEDLQVEIVHLRKELEEAEKHISSLEKDKGMTFRPVSGPEMEELQAEVDLLREELTKTQTDKQKQQYLIKSLKEEIDEKSKHPSSQIRESLDDVGSELHEMRDELQKLMGVIQSKDQAIETLENQLRHSKETVESREKEMQELQTIMSDIEAKKSINNSQGSTQSFEDDGESRRTDDGKTSDDVYRHFIESGFFKKSVREWRENRLARDSWVNYPELFNLEERSLSSSDKGNDRLQSLISKYRSHSEGSERKIKPLSLSSSNKMGLVTRGRSFGPAAPKGADGKVSQSSQLSNADEGIGSISVSALKRSTSPDSGDSEGPIAQSSPTPEDNLGLLAEGDVAVGLDFDADTEDDLDTQEQRDINSLIQNCYRSHLLFLVALRKHGGRFTRQLLSRGGKKRATHPKPILSVSPPKITSKVIADLLKTSQHSGSSGSSHDHIQSHSNIF